MKRLYLNAVLLVVALALFACGKKKEEEKESQEPKTKMKATALDTKSSNSGKKVNKVITKKAGKAAPETEWKGYKKTKLHIKSINGSEVSFYMSSFGGNTAPLTLIISTKKLPAHTVIVLGKKEYKTDKKGYGYFKHDVKNSIGALPLASIYHKRSYKKKNESLGIKFKVILPGYEPIEGDVPPINPASAVMRFLGEVEDGKVSFPGEPKHAGKISVLITSKKYSQPYITGRGSKVWDIDLVAVIEDMKATKTKKCRFTKATVTVSFKDAKATLYDRHTGKKLFEEVIKNSLKCPGFISYDKKKLTGNTSVGTKTISAWADKALAKYKM
jgi:hypothetical protein